jgi:hypothetical protein
MVGVQDVEAVVNELIEMARRSFRDETEAHYQDFHTQVNELDGLARETVQAKLDDLYWPILSKLEEDKPLTAAEHSMLELLMVGEAKYYLKHEDDVEQWRNELKRLIEEIKRLQASGLDEIDGLMRLRALCREATRVLPDLAYYFRERERVRQFEAITSGTIDTETRRSLANLIKEMMESDQI